MMNTDIPSSDFSLFCDFVAQLRDSGTQGLTPEQSVERFREEREKLRAWHERNAISQAQANRGEYRPLDLDDVMRRVRTRLAEQGRGK